MTRIVALLSVFAIAFSTSAAEPAKPNFVVLISIDGLAASYLADPKAELPTLRKLAKEGASASGMLTTFPSVTWPSHTSLITGATAAKHGVISNAVWSRAKNRAVTYIGDPELTKAESIKIPTLYDAAHDAGLSTASVIWPCSNGAKSLDYVIPDSNKPELHARYTTPGFADELLKAGIDIGPLGKWGWAKENSVPRDIVYTKVANYLLEKHQIQLLLVHLITPDGVEHAYGPHTREAYQAVKESDAHVAEIWATLQKPPFAGRSTMFVVSDHGFAHYTKNIRPNYVFKELGLITTDSANKVTDRKAWCQAEGGAAFIYFLDTEKCEEKMAEIRKSLGALEGVTGMIESADFAKWGLPTAKNNPEAPNLVLLTNPGYSFDGKVEGPAVVDAGGNKGTHGHDPNPAYMHATFLAAGVGIKPGVKLETIRNIDVAPTIAKLLGLELPQAEGKALEILAK